MPNKHPGLSPQPEEGQSLQQSKAHRPSHVAARSEAPLVHQIWTRGKSEQIRKSGPPGEEWDVANSRKGRKQRQQQLQKQHPQQQKEKQKKNMKGPKLGVTVLKPAGSKTYEDILSIIRTAVKPEDNGIKVRLIWQTRAGQLLLELEAPRHQGPSS